MIEKRSGALSMTLALASTLLAAGAEANERPPAAFQLALWNPVQIVDAERSIRGFRCSLFAGVNHDLEGLDISVLAGEANGAVVGYQTALMLNLVGGDFDGHQSALLNVVGGDFSGFQLGFSGSFTSGHVRGLQWSVAGGSSAGGLTGLQLSGFVNITARASGTQAAGLINVATGMKGLQASALINIAEELRGVQLGLLNFNRNGFLPFFPIFNIGL